MSYRGRAVTDAIITVLTNAGLRVGDGEKPANSGWAGTAGQSTFRAYVVVHPVGAFDIDGTLDGPSDDVWPLMQITSFGAVRAQCEETADDAREALLATPAAVVGGRSVARWRIDLVGVVTRTDDVQPPIYMAPDRYTVFTTPS
jgi:hypothetical protein